MAATVAGAMALRHVPLAWSSIYAEGGGAVNEPQGEGPFTRSDELLVWQSVASRRSGLDSMMWQTPALGMTAQAFLLTLALGAGSSRWARLLAALLSLILALMVMQLMAKHRRNEMLDSVLLEELEHRVGLDAVLGCAPHGGPAARPENHVATVDGRMARSTPGPRRFWDMSSYELWMVGLGSFAIVALAIIIIAAVGAGGRVFG